MSSMTPTVLEIDRKLRDDFRRRARDYGIQSDSLDPVLAVLFRTFAHEIEQVYGDVGRVQQMMLRELMSGLMVQYHMARPAQTVVRLSTASPSAKVVHAGTDLNAVTSTGERLTFGLDATCEVSSARIAFVLGYQDQTLQLLSGVERSELIEDLRPSVDPAPVNLGAQPAIYLAIENPSPSFLNRHAIFFDLGSGTQAIQHALSTEPWWIFGQNGDLNAQGLMRPRRVNCGVYQLDWQVRGVEAAEEAGDDPLPELPDGFYAGKQFLFPGGFENRDVLCSCPLGLRKPLSRIYGADSIRLFETPRLWIRIPMPPGIPSINHATNNILLDGITASNVFCRNQTIRFDQDGVSVPVVREDGIPEQLVAPLSVSSLTNEPYAFGMRAAHDIFGGWYEVYNNRLLLHPGRYADERQHEGVIARMWLTNGALANKVGPENVAGFANTATLGDVSVAPVAAAAGGVDAEKYEDDHRRFAESLMTRGRIVTSKDLEIAALAFDRRILSAQSHPTVERRSVGLRRVERLHAVLDADGFTQAEIELPALRMQLERSLSNRLVQGVELEVEFAWSE